MKEGRNKRGEGRVSEIEREGVKKKEEETEKEREKESPQEMIMSDSTPL